MRKKLIYEELTRDITIALGKKESTRQREQNGTNKTPSFTYGEIEFESICLAINWIQVT